MGSIIINGTVKGLAVVVWNYRKDYLKETGNQIADSEI